MWHHVALCGTGVKLEDAGFDWKVLGPDVAEPEYVAWQSDQDAYAFSGQKCAAGPRTEISRALPMHSHAVLGAGDLP